MIRRHLHVQDVSQSPRQDGLHSSCFSSWFDVSFLSRIVVSAIYYPYPFPASIHSLLVLLLHLIRINWKEQNRLPHSGNC
jgi:hypothetical protein